MAPEQQSGPDVTKWGRDVTAKWPQRHNKGLREESRGVRYPVVVTPSEGRGATKKVAAVTKKTGGRHNE
jgi:hypothetical protein